jgi:hypothetical protein
MRIVNNPPQVEFSVIKVGECFIQDKCLFVKIDPVSEGKKHGYNAFCFVDNKIAYIPDSWWVYPVEAEVIIKHRGIGNDT